ncbi:MAG: metallophosphoesterase family protein, partial [Spirochaetota bacterium]
RTGVLYDYFEPDRWEDIDLIISCGDLDPEYLSFLVTVIPAPLVYVHGNHDLRYVKSPPLGCRSVEDTVVELKGVTIGGLGGSNRYNGRTFQYTEKQMARRARKIQRKAKKMGGLDIIVTHAPPRGIHDLSDLCHRGFLCFVDVMEAAHPRVLVHGHNHQVYSKQDRDTVVNGVRVINACGYYCFEI